MRRKATLPKKWDAENFPGFWRDTETNVSTEKLSIDQSILDNSNRVIEKHSLSYMTYSVPFMYQVYANVNITPWGTNGFYQAMGWFGEKHVRLQENRLSRIILEQNASEVRSLTIGESWGMGDGYMFIANSIDAKAATPQGWFSLIRNKTKLDDEVMLPAGRSHEPSANSPVNLY